MAIPNFQQQSQQALQSGLQIGSALRNSFALQQQQELAQQQAAEKSAFNRQMQPLQLRQAELATQGQEQQNVAMSQENQKNQAIQGIMPAISLGEKEWKESFAPMLINQNQGNDNALKTIKALYGKTGKEFTSTALQIMSSLTGKPIGGKEKAPTKVAELEAAGYTQGTPEFQEAMKSLIFKDNEGKTSLKASDIKGINADVTGFVKPWKEVYRAARDLDALGGAKTPAAQMAMIFKFMKALDPASTVRESEYAQAQNTTGIPDRVWNMVQKASSGEFLSENQVKEFVDTAKLMSNSRAEGVSSSVADYLEPYGNLIDETRRSSFLKRADTTLFDIAPTKDIKIEPVEKVINETPIVGDVSDGYRFKGGDPKLESSWEKV